MIIALLHWLFLFFVLLFGWCVASASCSHFPGSQPRTPHWVIVCRPSSFLKMKNVTKKKETCQPWLLQVRKKLLQWKCNVTPPDVAFPLEWRCSKVLWANSCKKIRGGVLVGAVFKVNLGGDIGCGWISMGSLSGEGFCLGTGWVSSLLTHPMPRFFCACAYHSFMASYPAR